MDHLSMISCGVRHGCGGFGYDNGTNTIVASDDVWVDYIKSEKSGVASVSTIMTSVVISSGMIGRRRRRVLAARTLETLKRQKGRKRLSSDSRTTIGEYMLQAAEVMAVEIGKSTIEIAKAILDDKDRREAVVVALEEVYGIPPIERAIYATKLAKGNELMVGFLSLDPTYRLAWLQRMFPDVM
ncbi:hypothetical protein Sjap_019946 [Stephania japonica]|uniref:Uncharacterized protein n=1 Tax=Stephania japonica TaxID=461633 RepID=A0AAP0F593_9MAGN